MRREGIKTRCWDSLESLADGKDGFEGGNRGGGRFSAPFDCDIPFEFVGKVASAGAMTEASDIERGAAARHGQ